MRPISSIQFVEVDSYSYDYKMADRSRLQEFYLLKGSSDDIIMTKSGYLTDTYYGNIALLKKGKWYTPAKPLLKGTMRSFLLNKGLVREKNIHKDDLKRYEALTIFNAMIPFKKIIIEIENLQLEE